jgi:hypothetical protein
MTIDWRSDSRITFANKWALESVAPPAGNGTTKVTGFTGQEECCAQAMPEPEIAKHPNERAATNPQRVRRSWNIKTARINDEFITLST